MAGFRSSAVARAAVVAMAGAVLTVAQTGSASADQWVAEKVRIKAGNGLSECLTAYERSTDPMVLERCDTDNLRGNWRIIPYNEYGYFMAKNWASGECLDAGGQPSLKVYTSPCDRNDGGQIWIFKCDDGSLMSAGPTTKLTFWNDKTVSMRFSSGELNAKQAWDVVPRPGPCELGG